MQKEIKKINESFKIDFEKVLNLENLERLKIFYLGKKSPIVGLLKNMGNFTLLEKQSMGRALNDLKLQIQSLIDEKKEIFLKQNHLKKIENEFIDITLPGEIPDYGQLHPITKTMNEIEKIFFNMGFNIRKGPEIELEYYNFESLNIPKEHPARDMQDTFYISSDVVLRTHTSSVQIRIMEKETPPIRIIVPGKVYRCDADATHTPMFHQIEGLVVDENISIADLKGILTIFYEQIFSPSIKLRFRPSYFPFTEPSLEIDISCVICNGKGCCTCKQSGWMEIGGAGMVHPNVFKSVNYDSEKYTGFAFGMGVDRITMLKYGINDIRLFFENDIRFLKQF
ncbi:MAG: phenylalanine--tRNA ligase subunit alpha [bacterium]